MADELSLGDTWLYGTLGGDGTLTGLLATPPATIGGVSIYFDAVPQEVEPGTTPVIIIRHKPGREDDEERGNSGIRLITTLRYQIVANANVRSYATLSAVADRIDELLDLAYSSADKIFTMQRLTSVARTYFEGGKETREVGADWLCKVSQYV